MLPLISFALLSLTAVSAYTPAKASAGSSGNTCSCQSNAASVFAKSSAVTNAANKAVTPKGYVNTGTNSQSWVGGQGCLGFADIDTYDSTICSGLCDKMTECSTFSIYFEQVSGKSQVKCSFWGGVAKGGANAAVSNMIAGCNTYTSGNIIPSSGFSAPTWYGNAICDGADAASAYIGSKIFQNGNGAFNAGQCANACVQQGGSFYNTYNVWDSGAFQGQYCDIYSKNIPSSAYTNFGGKFGGFKNATISNSYGCGLSSNSAADWNDWSDPNSSNSAWGGPYSSGPYGPGKPGYWPQTSTSSSKSTSTGSTSTSSGSTTTTASGATTSTSTGSTTSTWSGYTTTSSGSTTSTISGSTTSTSSGSTTSTGTTTWTPSTSSTSTGLTSSTTSTESTSTTTSGLTSSTSSESTTSGSTTSTGLTSTTSTESTSSTSSGSTSTGSTTSTESTSTGSTTTASTTTTGTVDGYTTTTTTQSHYYGGPYSNSTTTSSGPHFTGFPYGPFTLQFTVPDRRVVKRSVEYLAFDSTGSILVSSAAEAATLNVNANGALMANGEYVVVQGDRFVLQASEPSSSLFVPSGSRFVFASSQTFCTTGEELVVASGSTPAGCVTVTPDLDAVFNSDSTTTTTATTTGSTTGSTIGSTTSSSSTPTSSSTSATTTTSSADPTTTTTSESTTSGSTTTQSTTYGNYTMTTSTTSTTSTSFTTTAGNATTTTTTSFAVLNGTTTSTTTTFMGYSNSTSSTTASTTASTTTASSGDPGQDGDSGYEGEGQGSEDSGFGQHGSFPGAGSATTTSGGSTTSSATSLSTTTTSSSTTAGGFGFGGGPSATLPFSLPSSTFSISLSPGTNGGRTSGFKRSDKRDGGAMYLTIVGIDIQVTSDATQAANFGLDSGYLIVIGGPSDSMVIGVNADAPSPDGFAHFQTFSPVTDCGNGNGTSQATCMTWAFSSGSGLSFASADFSLQGGAGFCTTAQGLVVAVMSEYPDNSYCTPATASAVGGDGTPANGEPSSTTTTSTAASTTASTSDSTTATTASTTSASTTTSTTASTTASTITSTSSSCDWTQYATSYGFSAGYFSAYNTASWDCGITSAFAAASIVGAQNLTGFCSNQLGYAPAVTSTVMVSVTNEVDVTITSGTVTEGTTNVYTTVPVTITITAVAGADNEKLRKRVVSVATPAPLTGYNDAVLSTACSFEVPAPTAGTVYVTSTIVSNTTVTSVVPVETDPAYTQTLTATVTSTDNSCEPTPVAQLLFNPSFECYDWGWDLDYDGAVLYWGPQGDAVEQLSAAGAAFIATQNFTSGGASGAGGFAGNSTQSGSDPSASQSAQGFSGSKAKRQESAESQNPAASGNSSAPSGESGYTGAYPHNDGLYTPNEPAYDGNTYVRLSPPTGTNDAGLGQVVNLVAGPYWMAYKYRVPTYALNNAECTLRVWVEGNLVVGPGIYDLTDPTDGWQPAGGFFTISEDQAGDNLLWFDFYCPPLAYSSGTASNKRQASSDPAQGQGSSNGTSPLQGTEGNLDPQPTVPLLDLDYIRMGVDDGGWEQYRVVTPAADDAEAADQSANVAAALAADGADSSQSNLSIYNSNSTSDAYTGNGATSNSDNQ